MRPRPSAPSAACVSAIRPSSRTEADVIIAIGGDGFMLQTLIAHMDRARADLRHESGHGRFPDERLSRATGLLERLDAAELTTLHPLRMAAKRADGKTVARHRDQRGVTAARNIADGQDPHRDRRQGAAAGAVLRRRSGGDARRQHGLQSVRPWPDHAAPRGPIGADPDQRVPAPALARRAAGERRQGAVRNPRAQETSGQRRRRLRRKCETWFR